MFAHFQTCRCSVGNSKGEWLTETETDMKTLLGNTEYTDTINTAQFIYGKEAFTNIAGYLAFTTIDRA